MLNSFAWFNDARYEKHANEAQTIPVIYEFALTKNMKKDGCENFLGVRNTSRI
jgi:hypothetical protein